MKAYEDAIRLQQSVLGWVEHYKRLESTGGCPSCSEEDKHQLHELAWQVVNLTRPKDYDDE